MESERRIIVRAIIILGIPGGIIEVRIARNESHPLCTLILSAVASNVFLINVFFFV